jgi:hypothetical protein
MPGPVSAAETAWTKDQELSKQAEINQAQLRANRPVNEFTPYGTKNWTDWGNNNWTSSETLSPNEQMLYDANTKQQLMDFNNNQLENPYLIASKKAKYDQEASDAALAMEENPYKRMALYDAYMTDKSKQSRNLEQLDYAKGLLPDAAKYWGLQDKSMEDYSNFINTAANDKLDMTGLGGIIPADAKDRQRLEDAMYSKYTSRLDPQFDEEQRKLGLRLVQSGMNPTSEAYKSAMESFGRTRNDAYSGARTDATEFGGVEQERQVGMQINSRKNALGERQADVASRRDSRNQRLGELSSKADMYSNAVKDKLQGYGNLTNIQAGFGERFAAGAPGNPSGSGSTGATYTRTATQPYNRPNIGGQSTAQMAGTDVGNDMSQALQSNNTLKQQQAAAKKATTTTAATTAATAAATIAAAAIAANASAAAGAGVAAGVA